MLAVVFEQSPVLRPYQPEPALAEGDTLIAVHTAGICATDLEILRGYMRFQGIMGHEFVGHVVDSPQRQLIGQRVVGEINLVCGRCDLCLSGLSNHCRNRSVLGISGHPGAFAERLRLPAENLHLVPSSIEDDQAVFVEPLAAALQILEAIHVQPRDHVIVIGAGKLGLLAAQVVRLSGADVAAVVRHERPARLLANWHIPALALSEVPAHRTQVVIDCTGTADGFADSLHLVEPRGTIVLKSTYTGVPQIDMTRIAVDEIKVVGSRCGPFDAALRLLEAGLVDVESLIDARYSLDDGLAAFDCAAQKGTLKVLLEMGV